MPASPLVPTPAEDCSPRQPHRQLPPQLSRILCDGAWKQSFRFRATELLLGFGFVLYEIVEVDVVFTDHLGDVPGRPQLEGDLPSPRLGVRNGILDGDVIRQ